ncbi:facilitated trehalose transporter Tret1-2 homolog isoform X4 [Danaus plexippus]|uniref:facilitated trehalose transporter Tret1-2 homolog isoform X4 n=1 Tax=Danaus plexippus TaxID=13037 RepID=UPI002AB172B3|nr:facilitated trehalose transporter Tret1-2 homolog isoform X4 [Danaus plexippus]
MSIIKQILSTLIITYTCTTLGLLFTLPSSTIKLFSSENTPLNRVMTKSEISIMGSISSATMLIITPFCGYLLDVLGRKRALIILFSPQLVAWTLLVTVKRVEGVICAMCFCGLGGSIFPIIPVYINEFCEPSVRGALSSSGLILHGIGMLLSYGIGGIVDYSTLNYIGLSLAVVGMVLFFFLKESPLYLMSKGLDKEAAKSIAYYKGVELDSKEVIIHLENLRQLIKNSDIKLNDIPEMESLNPETKATWKNVSIFKFFGNSPSSRRAFIVLIVLFTTCVFQGLTVVQVFAQPLFANAVPSMSSTVSSIIFGLTLIISSFVEAILVETIGRRALLIGSSLVTGLLCLILGTQIQFQWGPGWLTAGFIYIYAMTYTFGAGSVPYVLMGEIFLPQIKSFASTFIFEWSYFCIFLMLFMFNPLFNAYGLGPIFFIFAGFSFFTTTFAYLYLPETKQMSVDVIQKKFLERKIFK